MKIGNFPIVTRAIEARAKLIEQRDSGLFGVTIGGVYQDAEMVEKVRPAIIAVLNARILELEHDLRQLGVEIG